MILATIAIAVLTVTAPPDSTTPPVEIDDVAAAFIAWAEDTFDVTVEPHCRVVCHARRHGLVSIRDHLTGG